MNDYPRWKHILVALVAVFGVFTARRIDAVADGAL